MNNLDVAILEEYQTPNVYYRIADEFETLPLGGISNTECPISNIERTVRFFMNPTPPQKPSNNFLQEIS